MPPSESGETLLQIIREIATQFAHQVELALGAGKGPAALRLGHALEVAERLKRYDLKSKRRDHARLRRVAFR